VCFNPLPTRRSGDTSITNSLYTAYFVSIRSQPEGREIQAESTKAQLTNKGFNPLPTRRSGDTSCVDVRFTRRLCFNPLPTRRSGDTQGLQPFPCFFFVSIRSQPEGREIQAFIRLAFNPVLMFQSAPNPKVGRYVDELKSVCGLGFVSIRSQPEGREILQNSTIQLIVESTVSIRSQPEGREILTCDVNRSRFNGFQSAPNPKVGRYASSRDEPTC